MFDLILGERLTALYIYLSQKSSPVYHSVQQSLLFEGTSGNIIHTEYIMITTNNITPHFIPHFIDICVATVLAIKVTIGTNMYWMDQSINWPSSSKGVLNLTFNNCDNDCDCKLCLIQIIKKVRFPRALTSTIIKNVVIQSSCFGLSSLSMLCCWSLLCTAQIQPIEIFVTNNINTANQKELINLKAAQTSWSQLNPSLCGFRLRFFKSEWQIFHLRWEGQYCVFLYQ